MNEKFIKVFANYFINQAIPEIKKMEKNPNFKITDEIRYKIMRDFFQSKWARKYFLEN